MNEQMDLPEFTSADKIDSCFHNFEETPEIVGKLVEISDGTYGKQYTVATQLGEFKIGTYDVLSTKITEKSLHKFIKIKYLGEQISPKTKRKYKDFDVWVKE